MSFECILTKYLVPLTSLFSNIMVGLVPLIVGWMRYYSNNIKVLGQTGSSSTFDGYQYGIKLENKTLRLFVIDKINVFVNKEQFFTIDLEKQNFEKRTLEPFKQLIIEERWTDVLNHQHEKFLFHGVKFEIFTGGMVILINYLSFWQKIKRHKLLFRYFINKNLSSVNNQISLKKTTYNGMVVSKQVKFALHLFNENNIFERTILITQSGFMNDSVMGYNYLQPNWMKSVDLLEKHLKSELLKDSNYKFRIEEIGLNR